jgi:hypothetical protein
MCGEGLKTVVKSRKHSLKALVKGTENLTRTSLRKIHEEAKHGARKALKGR